MRRPPCAPGSKAPSCTCSGVCASTVRNLRLQAHRGTHINMRPPPEFSRHLTDSLQVNTTDSCRPLAVSACDRTSLRYTSTSCPRRLRRTAAPLASPPPTPPAPLPLPSRRPRARSVRRRAPPHAARPQAGAGRLNLQVHCAGALRSTRVRAQRQRRAIMPALRTRLRRRMRVHTHTRPPRHPACRTTCGSVERGGAAGTRQRRVLQPTRPPARPRTSWRWTPAASPCALARGARPYARQAHARPPRHEKRAARSPQRRAAAGGTAPSAAGVALLEARRGFTMLWARARSKQR
jgi:hypothetical protein